MHDLGVHWQLHQAPSKLFAEVRHTITGEERPHLVGDVRRVVVSVLLYELEQVTQIGGIDTELLLHIVVKAEALGATRCVQLLGQRQSTVWIAVFGLNVAIKKVRWAHPKRPE